MQKVRYHIFIYYTLTACKLKISVSFQHLYFRILFHLSFTLLVHYRLLVHIQAQQMDLLYSIINIHLTIYSLFIIYYLIKGYYLVSLQFPLYSITINYKYDLFQFPSPVLSKYFLVSFLLTTEMFHFIRFNDLFLRTSFTVSCRIPIYQHFVFITYSLSSIIIRPILY